MRIFIFILIWSVSVIIASIYTYENPELIERIRYKFEKTLPTKIIFAKDLYKVSIGNSFVVEFSQEISFSEKTAFIVHNENVLNFLISLHFENIFLENLR